ncbi:nuclear transport factor 2 family protein [Devosia sp.]|uniref:nuclear transport factor 2 family protein n=1 Tax=Devosia sp. TaxID=1871048 RepID=UPI002AFDD1E4|nr:nuclear transport factor 2 family protein [Devosia sp.]
MKALFARYEALFNQALSGEADMEAVAALYAVEVIGAAPLGVRAGKNDAEFRAAMAQGYAHYRAIGTREMRIKGLHITPIDALHCLAKVDWTSLYERKDGTEVRIDFEVHYLVQMQDGAAKVFGWITGDESAALREHGLT